MCFQENSVVEYTFDDYLKVIIFRTKYDNLSRSTNVGEDGASCHTSIIC